MVPTRLFAATLLPPLFDDMYQRCEHEERDLEAGTSTAAEQRKMFMASLQHHHHTVPPHLNDEREDV